MIPAGKGSYISLGRPEGACALAKQKTLRTVLTNCGLGGCVLITCHLQVRAHSCEHWQAFCVILSRAEWVPSIAEPVVTCPFTSQSDLPLLLLAQSVRGHPLQDHLKQAVPCSSAS